MERNRKDLREQGIDNVSRDRLIGITEAKMMDAGEVGTADIRPENKLEVQKETVRYYNKRMDQEKNFIASLM